MEKANERTQNRKITLSATYGTGQPSSDPDDDTENVVSRIEKRRSHWLTEQQLRSDLDRATFMSADAGDVANLGLQPPYAAIYKLIAS